MTGEQKNLHTQPSLSKPKKSAFKKIITTLKILSGIAIILAVLFIPAGTLFWIEAWLFLLFYAAAMIILILWLKKHDPELLKERATRKKEGKTWDKLLLTIYTSLFLLMFITCGLDAVRFQWIKVHFIIKITGFLGFIPVTFIIFNVYKENTFASEVVRIQDDREHYVIKTGPYKYVRHPMYSAIIILMVCLPLSLGSFLGLIFSALIIIVFFIRTYLEDRMLQKELSGYKEYTREVRYRLIPGVW